MNLFHIFKRNLIQNIIETLDRLSELVLDEEDYMQNVTEEAFTEILIEQENTKIVLGLKEFNKLEYVIKTRIIMQTTKILFGTSNGIEKKHVEDIIKLCGNNIGNKFLMPNKYYKISVKGGKDKFWKIIVLMTGANLYLKKVKIPSSHFEESWRSSDPKNDVLKLKKYKFVHSQYKYSYFRKIYENLTIL